MSARRLRWMRAAAVAAGLVFVIFFPQPYKPMDRPSDQSFDGRWVLDPASLSSVKKRTGKSTAASQLEFGSDGRLKVTDMPYEEGVATLPDSSLVTGEGRWRLERHQDWVMTFALDDRRGGTLFIELKDGKPSVLAYGVGDPDSSERWIWRKAP